MRRRDLHGFGRDWAHFAVGHHAREIGIYGETDLKQGTEELVHDILTNLDDPRDGPACRAMLKRFAIIGARQTLRNAIKLVQPATIRGRGGKTHTMPRIYSVLVEDDDGTKRRVYKDLDCMTLQEVRSVRDANDRRTRSGVVNQQVLSYIADFSEVYPGSATVREVLIKEGKSLDAFDLDIAI